MSALDNDRISCNFSKIKIKNVNIHRPKNKLIFIKIKTDIMDSAAE